MIPRQEIPDAVAGSLHLLNSALYQAQLADFSCEITELTKVVKGATPKKPREILFLQVKVREAVEARP